MKGKVGYRVATSGSRWEYRGPYREGFCESDETTREGCRDVARQKGGVSGHNREGPGGRNEK